jgi:hypothetical protein
MGRVAGCPGRGLLPFHLGRGAAGECDDGPAWWLALVWLGLRDDAWKRFGCTSSLLFRKHECTMHAP